ncbi:hypothetical protein G3T14_10265 [Methylobacterium sp. BTF04]|uniref:hypothetical protein n=1 Tax=Methylobacterium sp. BTF04 TaxID=2708300 RepID=UPI0013D34640|nr:hypothetical protein [Methylobacterium sp. BTF04]NEU12519.1 hypothetical protein [Methylobacterium sp. BTF04]
MPRLRTLSILLGLAGLSVSGAAWAQGAPRSMSECERLKNDLAYNQCLAMFGPAAKNVGGGEGSSASASASVATALAAIPPGLMATIPQAEEPGPQTGRGRHGRRGRYSRHGGRQSASFTVGGESRSYRRHRRRR